MGRSGRFLAVALTLLAGCVDDGGAIVPAMEVASNRRSVALENSLQINGIGANGAYINGLGLNSLAPNGLQVNGMALNGAALNGLQVNGKGKNGIGANGLPSNGVALNGVALNGVALNSVTPNGVALNGVALNGVALNGVALNGHYVNGVALNGVFVNGLATNGVALNGVALNGLSVNGVALNGVALNGVALNGLYVNGVALNGVALNGLSVNGSNPLKAIKIGDQKGDLVNLGTAEEKEFQTVMSHLAWCALPDGNSATIASSAGTPVVYPGHFGLAPEWKTGPLQSDPDAVDSEERVRWCLEHFRAVDVDHDLYLGLALDSGQLPALEKLLSYAVSCAIAPGDSVLIHFPDGDRTFQGALGLGTSWKSGPLDQTGQKAVSACLAARTNAKGMTVHISLRGPAQYPGLLATELERQQFTLHEGAFWGNLFGSAPVMNVCKDQGGGLAGRLCADGSCGFTPTPPDPCADTCTRDSAGGNWTGCGATAETIVLNTFLFAETTVAGGVNDNCVRRADNRLYCWGINAYGELGDGTTIYRPTTPAPVIGLPDPAVAGADHEPAAFTITDTGCARLRNGTLWCWGRNDHGQLGIDSTATMSTAPVHVISLDSVAGVGQVARVSAGVNNVCVVKTNGELWCWGDNTYGQIGDGTTTTRRAPVPVTALGNEVVAVSVGWDKEACALKLDGTLWCWGCNNGGEIGDGTTVTRTTPVPVIALGNQVVDVGVGNNHTCALKADRTVWCWGWGGLLGDGTSQQRTTPVRVTTLGSNVAGISVGQTHAAALKTDATLWTWGSNLFGEVGNGTSSVEVQTTPFRVTTLPAGRVPVRLVSIGSGSLSNLVTMDDGSVWGFGFNGGSSLGGSGFDFSWGGTLGDGTLIDRYVPVRMTVVLPPPLGPIFPANGRCDAGESQVSEPGECPVVCGDGLCLNGTETCSSCRDDCGACAVCGDGVCNGTETCSSCPGDCGACPPVVLAGDNFASGGWSGGTGWGAAWTQSNSSIVVQSAWIQATGSIARGRSLAGKTGIKVSYKIQTAGYSSTDKCRVQLSKNSGSTFPLTLATHTGNVGSFTQFTHNVTDATYAATGFKVKFVGAATSGKYCLIDDVQILANP